MEPVDDPADDFGEPDRLDTTTSTAPPSRARAVVLGGAVAVAGVLVAVTALSGVLGQSAPAPSSAPTTPSPSASRSIAWPTPAQPTPRPSAPPVFSSSGFLADLDLVVYARSNRAVYRIDTRKGRVTRTATQDWGETRSFLALPDRAMLVSAEEGLGYELVDGRPPRQLSGRLEEPGQLFPGPKNRVWLIPDTVVQGRVRALLLDAAGNRVYERVWVPENGEFSADGAGGLFWSEVGGTYRVTSDGLRRVTIGRVVATNRSGFLAVECSVRHVCASYAYEHAGGVGRKAGPAISDVFGGTLAPDGRYVAAVSWADGTPELTVVEVRTGREVTSFALSEDDDYSDPSAVWLPDGRLLLLVASRLAVVDPRTKKQERISLRLSPLRQLAVHSAG